MAFLLGEILPEDTDKDALKETEKWRIMYFIYPGAIYLVTLLSLIFIIKYDSIKNLITKGKIEEAKKHLCLVYKNCNADNVDLYIEKIRATCGEDSSGVSIKDAFFDPKYRKSTWVNVGYIIFHELTGIQIIQQFSIIIFTKMHKEGQSDFTPR